jgi:hypothetical protein
VLQQILHDHQATLSQERERLAGANQRVELEPPAFQRGHI